MQLLRCQEQDVAQVPIPISQQLILGTVGKGQVVNFYVIVQDKRPNSVPVLRHTQHIRHCNGRLRRFCPLLQAAHNSIPVIPDILGRMSDNIPGRVRVHSRNLHQFLFCPEGNLVKEGIAAQQEQIECSGG